MTVQFEALLAELIEKYNRDIAKLIHAHSPTLDADPKGLEAIVLSALLRGYADIIESRFGEGDKMGPLKTSVDEIRARFVMMLQKAAVD
jgi:hypothetical protein